MADLDVRGLACLALEAAKEAEAEKAAEMLISWLQERFCFALSSLCACARLHVQYVHL